MATFADVEKLIRGIEPTLKPDDESYEAMAVLLSSAICGPNMRRIKTFTGYPMASVLKLGHRIRANGIWHGKRVLADWGDAEDGAIALLLDTNVALGRLQRMETTP